MVERGAIRVDWLGARDGMMDEGMEGDVGRRRGDEWGRTTSEDQDESEEEGRGKKVRGGMMLMRGKETDPADNAEENMLELRLSLAVARSVPSPQHLSAAALPGSFVVHQHQNNHLPTQSSSNQHRLQQLAMPSVGREQSPVKPLMQSPSSPGIENHRDSQSRAKLTASLKHLVSQQQQQPVKGKPTSRFPGLAGSTLQYAVPPVPQLHRGNPPPVLRSSPCLQEGPDSRVVHFPGIDRLTPSAQLASPGLVSQVVQPRQQEQQSVHFMNQSHESLYPKGYPHQNNINPPRHSAHHILSRNTAIGFPLQLSGRELLLQQERHQGASLGQTIMLPSSPSGRIFANSTYSPQAVSLPITGPQVQAFLQHQSSNAVSVASHRQTQPSASHPGAAAFGKNLSAFSVVRPPATGSVPSSIGEVPPREKSADCHHVVVSVCDRKVKLTSEADETSLYTLCRRWVRNDVLRRDQSVRWDCNSLPRPLPAAEIGMIRTEPAGNCEKVESANGSQGNLPNSIESMTEKELLEHHVEHFKNCRKRCRDNRMQRISRFMPRLALLLPICAESGRQ